MKRRQTGCSRFRQDLSLLAADAIHSAEATAARDHLAGCADCQRCFGELQALSRGLRQGPEIQLEPTAAFRARWQTAVLHVACGPSWLTFARAAASRFQMRLAANRWALAALAPVWLLIVFFKFTAPETEAVAAAQSAHSPREILHALKSQRQLLATWPAEPPAGARTSGHPRPRSQQSQQTPTA